MGRKLGRLSFHKAICYLLAFCIIGPGALGSTVRDSADKFLRITVPTRNLVKFEYCEGSNCRPFASETGIFRVDDLKALQSELRHHPRPFTRLRILGLVSAACLPGLAWACVIRTMDPVDQFNSYDRAIVLTVVGAIISAAIYIVARQTDDTPEDPKPKIKALDRVFRAIDERNIERDLSSRRHFLNRLINPARDQTWMEDLAVLLRSIQPTLLLEHQPNTDAGADSSGCAGKLK
jgi:hypothetical protein